RVSSEATSAPSTSSTETAPSALSDFDPLGATLLTEVHKVDGSQEPRAVASSEVPSESSEPQSLDSLEPEEADEPSANVDLDDNDSSTQASFDAPAAPDQQHVVAAETRNETKQTAQSANKPASKSKSNVWWVPAALIAVATGLGLYMTKSKPDVHVAKGPAATREEAEPVAAPAEPAVSEHVDAPVDLSREPSAEQASAAAMVNEPGAQAVSAAAASENETTPAQAAAVAMEQPFVVVDTNKPSCEVLLGEEVPQGGRDLVHQASL